MALFRIDTSHWHIVRLNFLMAGAITLLSILLTVALNDLRWLILTGFVGTLLTTYALTGYCPSSFLLEKLGVPRR